MLRTNAALLALVIANGLVSSITRVAEAEQEKVPEAVLPVLATVGEGKVARGQVTRVRLRLGQAAAGDDVPLELGIFETSPMGIGPSLRSSAWMAAMVAAFETDALLVQRRIELHIPGYVDGPSTAALLAGGTMAALQGKQWPSDVSIAGSLCPDGTIGPVGGIPQKLQAASKAGINRIFIPKDQRRDVDLKTGQDVDLYTLAESLKVQLLPVAHIQDVAKELGFAQAAPTNASAQLAVPKEISRVYIQEAERHLAGFNKTWAGISDEERKANSDAETTAKRSQEALRTGQEAVAADLARVAFVLLESNRVTAQRDAAMNGKLPESIDDWEKLLDAQADKVRKSFEESLRASAFALRYLSDTTPEFGQMAAIGETETRELLGSIGLASLETQQAIENARSSKLKGTELEKALRPWLTTLTLCEEVSGRLLQASHGRLLAMSRCFPRRPGQVGSLPAALVTGQTQLMWSAAHGYMGEGFIRARADQWDCTTDEAKETVWRADDRYGGSLLAREGAIEMSERSTAAGAANADIGSKAVSGTRPTDLLHYFLGTAYADDMAILAGTQFVWESLLPELDNNRRIKGYKREAALSAAMNTARSRAVQAIADAQAKGVNCVGSVIAIQQGDHDRDSQEGEKRNALRHYWRAYLEARVLRMFQQQTDRQLALYEKRIQVDPRDAAAHYFRGCLLMNQGQTDTALASLSKAIEIGPAPAEYFLARGHLYLSQADCSRAAMDYAMAEKGGAKDLSLYVGWAKALGGLGQYEQAIAPCDKACRLYPDVAEAYLLRSRLFALANNEKKASEDLVRARELTPEWSWTDVMSSPELRVPPKQNATTKEGVESPLRAVDESAVITRWQASNTNLPRNVPYGPLASNKPDVPGAGFSSLPEPLSWQQGKRSTEQGGTKVEGAKSLFPPPPRLPQRIAAMPKRDPHPRVVPLLPGGGGTPPGQLLWLLKDQPWWAILGALLVMGALMKARRKGPSKQ